jgi:hypothetical protein
MMIGRCCVRVIERIQMEGERALVEYHVGCGCINMRVLLGRPREMGGLAGGQVHSVDDEGGEELGREGREEHCEASTIL